MPTISEATVLESRVSKLEQDNRRLILVVIALLLVLTVFYSCSSYKGYGASDRCGDA